MNIVINALFPVLAIILTGILLKKTGLLDKHFFASSDRFVYYVLFPVLLFWKIGAAPLVLGSEWHYLAASGCSYISTFAISLFLIKALKIAPFQAGSFNQSCYRFNTYMGMAVVINLFGEKGVQLFAVLIGLIIPFVNSTAVAVLVWFNQENTEQNQLAATLKTLVKNPLIIASVAGLVYAHFLGGYPVYVTNTLELLSTTTLPLALLSIGGALSFHLVRNNLLLSLLGAMVKLVVLPCIGLVFLFLFSVTGLAWKVSVLFYSLPASTAIYVLSSQLHADTELASASVVVSTCCSFVTMSVIIMLIMR
ncbi:MAG: transporter [Desulfobulbus propionicus]|nr:MAG: transporter [Desulfobulbus propionicus]